MVSIVEKRVRRSYHFANGKGRLQNGIRLRLIYMLNSCLVELLETMSIIERFKAGAL